MRRAIPHLIAAILLAIFVLALFYRLLFTDRVLASGDILLYFYPYRSYASAALRAGTIPLWNPYIFSGAPFLANPQAAVLYPLHWPLSWLPVTKQIYTSGALHAWILGAGGYALLRRWGYGWPAGLVTALTLAGSGFYGGLLGHINQMNAAAWLPWMVFVFAVYDLRLTIDKASARPVPPFVDHQSSSMLAVIFFSLLVALTLLAGHTQTAYINLFGVGGWLVGQAGIRYWVLRMRGNGRVAPMPDAQSLVSAFSSLLPNLLAYLLGIILGVLLAAAQLLPTLELSELGLRGGGLTYWDVTSFSLRPLRLPWTLLPTYGLSDLSVVFGPAFTEFVAYIGIIPFLLALIGLWRGRWQRAWIFGLLFAGVGLFLALGRWNPAYYVLYKLIPGFDLFRAPARWMMLYTLGMAVLAGIGVEGVRNHLFGAGQPVAGTGCAGDSPGPSSQYASSRRLQMASILLPVLLAADLLLAARALPHTHPTAPQAVYDVRTAPAHLRTDPQRELHPAAMGRFLSLSTIEFDPGDMVDWRRIYRGDEPQLDENAFLELIVALKAQEILAPNLPLFWRVPAVDGFDGGVLPLQRYNQLMALLIPPHELVPDGRIREQLDDIPGSDLLSLMNARYVITDKVRDLWFEGVYYDRQLGATLDAVQVVEVQVNVPRTFEATTIGVIGFVEANADSWGQLDDGNQSVAQIQVLVEGNVVERIPLIAGGEPGAHFADARPGTGMAERSGAIVAYQDVVGERQEYLAWLKLGAPTAPDALRIEHAGHPGISVTVQAVTLVDERTETFQPLLPSDQGRFRLVHSGDVKLYEATDVQARATLAASVDVVSSPQEALARLREVSLEGRAVVEMPAEIARETGIGAGSMGGAEITAYAPEHVAISTSSNAPGLLVLRDAFYPGWTATVDGQPAPIYPTNLLFRGVPVPAGEHEVVFTFRPQSWQWGLGLSSIGGLLWMGFLLWGWWRQRQPR